MSMRIGLKLKWNAWYLFLFPSDQALRRGLLLQPLPCFLLFPCTSVVFTGRGTVLHSPPVSCDTSPFTLQYSSITRNLPRNLVLVTRSDGFGAGSSQHNLLCTHPGEDATVQSVYNAMPFGGHHLRFSVFW